MHDATMTKINKSLNCSSHFYLNNPYFLTDGGSEDGDGEKDSQIDGSVDGIGGIIDVRDAEGTDGRRTQPKHHVTSHQKQP